MEYSGEHSEVDSGSVRPGSSDNPLGFGCRGEQGTDPDDSMYGLEDVLDWSQPGQSSSQPEPSIEIYGLDHVLTRRIGRKVSRFTLKVKKLVIPRGTFCCITGDNGCGKTTLLTIMGLLQRPSHVDRFVLHAGRGTKLQGFSIGELWNTRHGRRSIQLLRRRELGFVLQSGGLLESLTAAENIEFVLRANGYKRMESRERIAKVCQPLGLTDKLRKSIPRCLSGGEQQIAALARSVAHHPSLILVDEPTASLHSKRANKTLTLLKQMQDQRGTDLTVVMVTHDQALAKKFGTFYVRLKADLDRNEGSVESIEG
ncbi:MAG: ABC transporter ATP-binding protein [Desulfatiglandales bacterium]